MKKCELDSLKGFCGGVNLNFKIKQRLANHPTIKNEEIDPNILGIIGVITKDIVLEELEELDF